MPWYVAHVIVAVRYKDHNQNNYPVWENMVLIEAPSPDEAEHKATALARKNYVGDDDGSFTCDGRPATMEFVGIRKIIACACDRIEDGVEVTYSQLEPGSEEDLMSLAEGEAVDVRYEE